MTLRAVLLGLLGAAVVAGATYYNDYVINQKWFIGQHLPTIVLGLVLPLALGVNPLLGWLRPGLALSRREIAVAVGLMLIACGLPGSGFWRYYGPVVAKPAHVEKVQPEWQALGVLGYVPGGPPLVPAGYVTDWRPVVTAVTEATPLDQPPDDPRGALAWGLARLADAGGQDAWRKAADLAADDTVPEALRSALRRAINQAIADPGLTAPPALRPVVAEVLQTHRELEPGDVARINRHVLSAVFPEFLPPPRGSGALLEGGRADSEVVRQYLWGERGSDVPWSAHWPTLRLWGGVGLLLATSVLLLTVVVHPQWSRRELLPYPIARFVTEITAREEGSGWLPDICRNRVFWVGVTVPVVFFIFRGLHSWFGTPDMPSELQFGPLRDLFPNAARVPWASIMFTPRVRFSAIAVAFLLPVALSFSIGISTYIYAAIAAMLLSAGIGLDTDVPGSGKFEWIRAGGIAGILVIVAYEGRRYYLSVAARSVGLRLGDTPPASAVWAARALLICFAAATALLSSSGVAWHWAAALLLIQLGVSLVLARIIAETGFYFFSGMIAPVSLMLGLLGFEALGPTTVLLLSVAGMLTIGNVREAAGPFFINAMKLGEPEAKRGRGLPRGAAPSDASVGRFGIAAVVALVLSMVVAGWFTLSIQQARGVSMMAPDAAWQWGGFSPYARTAGLVRDAEALGTLDVAVRGTAGERLAAVNPSFQALRWTAVGLVAVLVLGVMRLRLPGWPLHPIIIVLLGGWTTVWLGFSFLLGWAVKYAVLRTSGAKGYRAVLPFMMGLIAGEVTMGLFWAIVGWTYHGVMDLPPPRVHYF